MFNSHSYPAHRQCDSCCMCTGLGQLPGVQFPSVGALMTPALPLLHWVNARKCWVGWLDSSTPDLSSGDPYGLQHMHVPTLLLLGPPHSSPFVKNKHFKIKMPWPV